MYSKMIKNAKPSPTSFFHKPTLTTQLSLRSKSSTVISTHSSTLSFLHPIEIKMMYEFTTSRSNFDKLLKRAFSEGSKQFSNHELDKALVNFDKIIQLAHGQNADDLTANERKLIARAYTHKAKILRIGSESSEDAALVNLEIALDMWPTLAEALSTKESILSERNQPTNTSDASTAAPILSLR